MRLVMHVRVLNPRKFSFNIAALVKRFHFLLPSPHTSLHHLIFSQLHEFVLFITFAFDISTFFRSNIAPKHAKKKTGKSTRRNAKAQIKNP